MRKVKKIMNWWAGGVSFTAEYQAIIARATTLGYTLPSQTTRTRQNNLIVSLKAAGIWNKIDILYIFCQGDATLTNFATLNWKNPATFQITPTNSPTYGIYGFTGNGTNAYLRTGWIPASSGVNFTQDDASLFYYQVEAAVSAGLAIGTSNAGFSKRIFSSPHFTGDLTYHEINSGTNHVLGGIMDGNGFTHDKRTASNATAKFVNGVSIDTSTAVSTGLSTVELLCMCENQNGTPALFIANTIQCLGAGSSMTTQNSVDLYNYYNTYIQTFAADITFPDPENASLYSQFVTARNTMGGYITHELAISAITTTGPDTLTGTQISHNAVVGNDDWIYYIPRKASYIARFNTTTHALEKVVTGIAPSPGAGSIYAGGIYIESLHKIFMCPYYGGRVGILDTNTLAYVELTDALLVGNAMWGGWAPGSDGNLYACPVDASWILCFNPNTQTIFQLSNCPPGTLAGVSSAKYAGAIQHKTEVHFALLLATVGMYVDVVAQTYGTYGSGIGSAATQKHAGIIKSTKTGYGYMVPLNDDKIRVFDFDAKTLVATITAQFGFIGGFELPSGQFLFGANGSTRMGLYDPVANVWFVFGTIITAGSFSGIIMSKKGTGITCPLDGTTIYEVMAPLGFNLPRNYLLNPTINKF